MKRLLLIFSALFTCALVRAQVFDVDTINMTGPTADRINIVFLPDGYQENELGKFIEDCHWMEDALLGKSPYIEYRAYFNTFAIKVPSNVSGAANDPDSLIDNYFGSTFNSYGIWRLVTPQRSDRIFPVLRDNFPEYDQVILIVNDSRYGGSGGSVATSTTHVNGPEICIHEMGHSFGGLSDEYWAGDQYARENINMTQETDPSKVRWKNWIDYLGVGIYAHAESPTWYRPHQNCEMRFLDHQFCPVCREAITEKILSLTDPVMDYSPAENDFVNEEQEVVFSVDLLKPDPNTFRIDWVLNGDSVAANCDTLPLPASRFLAGSNTLTAYILDTTGYIRKETHASAHLHEVTWNFENSASGIDLKEAGKGDYQIRVFPNPVTDRVSVRLTPDGPATVGYSLLSLDGRSIRLKRPIRMDGREHTESFDLKSLGISAGLYRLAVEINGHAVTLPLVVE